MKLKDLIIKLKELEDDHGEIVVACYSNRGEEGPVDTIGLCERPSGSIYEIHLFPY